MLGWYYGNLEMEKFGFSFCGGCVLGRVGFTLTYQGSEEVFIWRMTGASRECLVNLWRINWSEYN